MPGARTSCPCLLAALRAGCLLLGLCLGWQGARAEDPPPGAPEGGELHGEALSEQVARWIAELRSDLFDVREQARRGLKLHGLKAREQLERAAQDEDPEVRRTIQALLQGAPEVARATVARSGEFDSLGRVSVRYEALSAGAALADLGARIGATFQVPEGLGAAPITVVKEDAPAFDVLHEVLLQARLRMPRGFAEDGSVALEAGKDEVPIPRAAAGPLELRVSEVSVTRALSGELIRRYGLTFELRWLPAVHVQQYESLRLEIARDPEGRAWVSQLAQRGTTTYGVGRGEMFRSVALALQPGSAEGPEQLGVLEVVLPLRLRYAGARVRVDDTDALPVCRDAKGRDVPAEAPGSVLFHSLTQPVDSPSQWVAEVRAWLPDGVEQDSLEVQAFAADGTPARMYVYGGRSRSADGTVSLTARTLGRAAGRPAALGATWFTREEQGSLRFRLTDVPMR